MNRFSIGAFLTLLLGATVAFATTDAGKSLKRIVGTFDHSEDQSGRSESNKAAKPHARNAYFLFNGQLVEEPFQISQDDQNVVVNGLVMSISDLQRSELIADMTRMPRKVSNRSGKRLRSGMEVPGIGAFRRPNRQSEDAQASQPQNMLASRVASSVEELLSQDVLMIYISGQPVLVETDSGICDALLGRLSPQVPPPVNVETVDLVSVLPEHASSDVWVSFFNDFPGSQELVERTQERFRQVDQLVADAKSKMGATYTLSMLSYPLTVLGMLLAIGGFGHLLRSVPQMHETDSLISSDRLQRATVVAVLLIAAFSALDLVWTILGHQAGTMRELNPLGGHLIHNPLLLTGFKVAATGIGCGLLYHLRENRRAADAAWWMCLLMTFVTFRWVAFNSMFA